MPIELTLCPENSCLDCFHAIAVTTVSLTTFRNIFQFSSSDINNNTLSSSVLDDTSADISYIVNNSLYPSINPSHSMMDHANSLNAIVTNSSSYSNLVKHDLIRYYTEEKLGTAHLIHLYSNWVDIKNNFEELGWDSKLYMENILSNANNLDNSNTTSSNISRELLKQIDYYEPSRLNNLQNTSSSQPIPFEEGDSINFLYTIIIEELNKKRIYKISLILTDNVSNTIPQDSLSDQNHSTITDYGVPV